MSYHLKVRQGARFRRQADGGIVSLKSSGRPDSSLLE